MRRAASSICAPSVPNGCEAATYSRTATTMSQAVILPQRTQCGQHGLQIRRRGDGLLQLRPEGAIDLKERVAGLIQGQRPWYLAGQYGSKRGVGRNHGTVIVDAAERVAQPVR